MAFNRLVDARFDAENPRTRHRHLPAGLLTRNQVIGFIIANGILFIAGAATFNTWTRILAVLVWLLLLSYSLWKRWSWLCHWILGMALGLSPVGAWIAIRGEIALFPILLGAFLMFWVTGFDLIYSTQDADVDRSLGLHSVPARFGRGIALRVAAANHVMMWGIGGLLVGLSDGHWGISGAWILTAGILIYIHRFRRSDDLDQLNRDFFIANGAISVLWLMGILFWVYGGKTGV